MTEAEWLKSRQDGWPMLTFVIERLSSRKLSIVQKSIPKINGNRPALPQLAPLLREQLGNPFRPYHLEPRWLTETVVALAAGIEADRAFDRMPILADALEDAGCDDRPMLDHLRGPGPHAVGCWVLDLLLNREPELFSLPPLVPTIKLGRHTPPPEGMA